MPFDGRVERGLLMSAPLVVQTMRGRKTNTRRIGDRYRRWRKGDLVYIRETWRIETETAYGVGAAYHAVYRADGKSMRVAKSGRCWPPPDFLVKYADGRNRPGIHMPKWAARIWCELTEDVRYVPLQSITDEDAVAEGVTCWVCGSEYDGRSEEDCCCFHSNGERGQARDSFSILWDQINAGRAPGDDPDAFTWARNPEVAVLRYRVISTTGRPAS